MRRFLQTYSFLLSGRWIGWFIVCCLGAALCLYLGNWQYDRAEQIDHSNQLIIDNYDADPLTGQEALSAFEDYDGSQRWHPVQLRGEYLTEDTVLARNRASEGQIGYEVLVPLRTQQGAVVLISRGWIPTSETGDGSPPRSRRLPPARSRSPPACSPRRARPSAPLPRARSPRSTCRTWRRSPARISWTRPTGR